MLTSRGCVENAVVPSNAALCFVSALPPTEQSVMVRSFDCIALSNDGTFTDDYAAGCPSER